jgi:hypothetical protein
MRRHKLGTDCLATRVWHNRRPPAMPFTGRAVAPAALLFIPAPYVGREAALACTPDSLQRLWSDSHTPFGLSQVGNAPNASTAW